MAEERECNFIRLIREAQTKREEALKKGTMGVAGILSQSFEERIAYLCTHYKGGKCDLWDHPIRVAGIDNAVLDTFENDCDRQGIDFPEIVFNSGLAQIVAYLSGVENERNPNFSGVHLFIRVVGYHAEYVNAQRSNSGQK